MPVVLGPGSPASLFHEVCGHGLEGDIAGSPGGAYGLLIGSRVAAPSLTIVDDPRAPGHAPLYSRDDEGEPARETTLVDHGVVAAVLADRATCRLLRRPPTGNGRRIGYQHPALTRMSCTYIKAGDVSPAAALEGVRHGLYVAGITSGETTMSGESFQARASEAYLIDNGALTRPVAGAVLSGHGLDLLRAVDTVCDDLRFLAYGFHCNKLGQYPLTVSVGQPTLRVRRLTVHP
jgi:TldD protein